MSLLIEIARCRNIENCLRDKAGNDPCATIVACQNELQPNYQLPEPWSGHLETAPILFVSSNPSIAESEEYPMPSWTDDEIADFFENRFGGGRKEWVKDGRYPLLKKGGYKEEWVRYWAAVRKRAAELLDRPDVRPGIDYAMTEVVHCKSRREEGVKEAAPNCAGHYLIRIVAAAGAKVIVSMGKPAAKVVRETFKITGQGNVSDPIIVGERERLFAFLPHPNSRGKRSFAACLSPDETESLRSLSV